MVGEITRGLLVIVMLLVAAVVDAAPDGAVLYKTHCAACHGDKGDGGVGIPLALPAFQASVDDVFLRQSIRHGRPGRVMPAFPKLSDAQVDAIVGHIRSWSDKPSPEFSSRPVVGDSGHGKKLFALYCVSCHGEHGEGGKGTGVTFSRSRDLPIIAPALNNAGFLAAASDAMIKHTLIHGREETPMPAFLEKGLSERDIDDIVVYLRTFAAQEQSHQQHEQASHEPVIMVESAYSLEETVENLKQSIAGQNYRLIRTEALEHGLVDEGQENSRQIILHFCNFSFLYEALAIDPRVGLFLPCRITVSEVGDRVQVMTINPEYMSHTFNNAELDDACEYMRDVYRDIIEDATL